jgi:hypothetical protein
MTSLYWDVTNLNWQFITEVSGQFLGPIFFLECSMIEDGNYRLYRNVGNNQYSGIFQKSHFYRRGFMTI